MNAVAVIETPSTSLAGAVMSPAQLTAKLKLIQSAMTTNMERGTDYGKIPGTPKPTLFKPGAEKLCTMFGIAAEYISEDLSTSDCVRIRVQCIGLQQGSKMMLGSGVGECSTDETKYKWRRPVCQQEFDETPDDRRRTKWLPGKGGKPYRATQVRTEPADLANTVLKMAAKRAHIAMVLNVTGATAIFTQDVEDMPQELRPAHVDEDGVIDEEAVQQQQSTARRAPQAKANAPDVITADQLRMLLRKMDDAGMNGEQLCARFKIDAVAKLKFSELNAALAYVADPQLHEVKQ